MATRFLDVSDVRALISKVGLHGLMESVVLAIESDFLRWEEFEKVPRTAHHAEGIGVLELMPVGDAERFSFKYVNGHPYNPRHHQLATVMAYGALAEVQTGFPTLLSEMTILTAIRTAATSLLAARHMARPGSRTMAMIGNGAQAEFQILAFHHGLGIDTVQLFDIDERATEKVVRNLAGTPGLRLVPCEDTAASIRGCDVVTTCTADKNYATIVTNAMVEPGMHLNAIGGDCPGKTELESSILDRARVIVEFEEQSRIEGEIQHRPDIEVTELFRVLRGEVPGRATPEEITVFDSVGFALEDFSTLRVVESEARAHHIGSEIRLVPENYDVKDLFGLIAPITASRRH